MKSRRSVSNEPPRERAALVSLVTRASRQAEPDIPLDELAGLALAAGAEVVLRLRQERNSADSSTLLGKGKVEELKHAASELGATLVIVDNELSPAQARNLERAVGLRVIDRTELILDIFAQRARTREGQLQVELAQLQYALPRLAGSSDALSRLGGGIGTRGPGETKLETDRRRIRERISVLKADIAEVRRRRSYVRARRKRSEVPVVALVGYTNAGKSTLFNSLTNATATASDALFVTLDPLMRRVRLPDARQIMIADTVGFIDRLPHQVVAAFHGTLEEVTSAELLLHVIDASAPDRERRMAAVRAVLLEVGAEQVPTVEVFNKIDRLSPIEIEGLRASRPDALLTAAVTTTGRAELLTAIARGLSMDAERLHLEFDDEAAADRRLVADLYRHARVIRHETTDGRVAIEADVPRRMVPRYLRARVPA